MVGDAAIVLQEFIGYMFYRSHVPFQEFLWLKGTGGNAKSALTRRITALLGRDNVSSIKPAALADPARRFESANLYGKEANIVADVGEDYIKGTDILKALTGGDSISAEFKGIQNFSFTNYAKMMFAANAMPAFSDKSEGFADRVMVIEMINGNVRHTDWWKQFDEEAIEREQPAWAMHCMQLFAAALKRHSFTQVQSVIDASQQWLDDNDHFKEFISQYTEIIPNETRGAVVTNVVAEYKAFCEQNGYSDKTSSKTITNRLSEWGITPRKTTQGFDDDDHTGNLNRYPGLHLTGSLLNPRYNK
jgi:putative DNA primase/helicase